MTITDDRNLNLAVGNSPVANLGVPISSDKQFFDKIHAHASSDRSIVLAKPLQAEEPSSPLSETAQKLDACYHQPAVKAENSAVSAINLARNQPNKFFSMLEDFASTLSENELCHAGSFLPKRSDRVKFSTECGLDKQKVEECRIEQEFLYIESICDFSDLLFTDAELLSHIDFMDRSDTLFLLGRNLAKSNPSRFCLLTPHFSKRLSKDCMLELGTFITARQDGVVFCNQCGIPSEEMEQAYELSQKNQKSLSQRMFEKGICHGYTVALAAQEVPIPNPFTEVRGRFLQANHLFTNRKSYDSHYIAIAEKVLKSPTEFKRVIAKSARVLGLSKPSDLLNDIKLDTKNKNGMKVVIASIAKKMRILLRKRVLEIEGDAPTPVEADRLKEKEALDKILDAEPMPKCKEYHSKALQRRQGFKLGSFETELTPIDELSHALTDKSKGGAFLLSIKDKLDGHAIYVSFDALSFCDTRDKNVITTIPKVRKFSSAESLIEGLVEYLKGFFIDTFRLVPVARNPSSSGSSRRVGPRVSDAPQKK